MAKPQKGPAPSAPKPPALPPAPMPAPSKAVAPSPAPGPFLTYTQKVLIAVGISTAAILLTLLLFYLAHILVLIFAGLLLAVFISAPSDLIAKHSRFSRGQALLMVLAAMAIIVFGGGYLMGRTVVDQTRQIKPAIEGALAQMTRDLQKKPAAGNNTSTQPAPLPGVELVPSELPSTQPDVMPPAEPLPAPVPATAAGLTADTAPATAPVEKAEDDKPSIAEDAQDWLTIKFIEVSQAANEFLFSESFVRRAGSVAGGVVSSTFAVIADITIIFGVGLFFAINPGLYSSGVVKLLPKSRRERTGKILHEVGTQLEWWFVGQLCSMASIGLLTFIGLKILGIPMAATLAILAGLLNFIPNFGPILAAAPALILALAPAEGTTELRPALAGWTVVLYVIIQLLEGWVITPFFQQRAVEIPPALIILAQVIFAMLLGPLGLILATPMLAATLVIIRMAYVEDLLGDQSAADDKGKG